MLPGLVITTKPNQHITKYKEQPQSPCSRTDGKRAWTAGLLDPNLEQKLRDEHGLQEVTHTTHKIHDNPGEPEAFF